MKKGYPTTSGYMGYIPNKGYTLFASDSEYWEWFDAHKEEWER